MQTAQDQFFDANYWAPEALAAAGIGISSALGTSVVYDSHVQGAWTVLRDRTVAQFGAPSVLGENEWVNHYVNLRRDNAAAGATVSTHVSGVQDVLKFSVYFEPTVYVSIQFVTNPVRLSALVTSTIVAVTQMHSGSAIRRFE